MRLLVVLALAACSHSESSSVEVARRGWHAHALVLRAGETATSCIAAGVAMKAILITERQALLDAAALATDKTRVGEATDYIAAHPDEFPDLDDRTAALEAKCGADPGVAAALRRMANPDQAE